MLNVEPETIFIMGTNNGVCALGLEGKVGMIEKDYYTDISIVALPNDFEGDVYSGLLSNESDNIFTMVNGVVCYDKRKAVKLAHLVDF